MKMERSILFWTALLVLGFSMGARAQGSTPAVFTSLGNSPVSGQVTCGAAPTLLYAMTASGGAAPWGRLSLTFQNQSATAVYVAPRADISTANAGILLGVQYQSVTLDRTSGNASWYCTTSSGSATVGWTEEK